MDMLNYEDDLQQDPEIATAVADIPPRSQNVKMYKADPPLGFEPELGHSGYDHNLVQASEDTGPGSTSPITAQEDRMLDTEPLMRAPGTGRPGLDENPGRPITKKE